MLMGHKTVSRSFTPVAVGFRLTPVLHLPSSWPVTTPLEAPTSAHLRTAPNPSGVYQSGYLVHHLDLLKLKDFHHFSVVNNFIWIDRENMAATLDTAIIDGN